jgi:hypothetical protein
MSTQPKLAGNAAWIVAIVACGAFTTAPAQECVDYPAATSWVSEQYFNGSWGGLPFYRCLAASGDTLVASDIGGSIFVWDASRPDDLRLVGQTRRAYNFGSAHSIALGRNCLFAMGYRDTLHTISLAEPATPVRVGSLAIGLHDAILACQGALLCAADATDFGIWDIARPAAPVPLSRLALPLGAVDLVVQGPLAYVATATGLLTVDVTDPGAPRLLGEYREDGLEGRAIAVQNDHAYLVCRTGLVIIDIADPAAPRALGRVAAAGGDAIAVEGSWAAVTGHYGIGVRTIDVSDPLNPRLVSETGCQVIEHRGAVLRNGHLFTVACDGNYSIPPISSVLAFRLGAAATVMPTSTVAWSPTVYGDVMPAAMDIAGDRARCLTTFPNGFPRLDILDLASPDGPTVIGSVEVHGDAVAWRDSLACVAGVNLEIVDLTVATQPRVVVSLPLPGVLQYGMTADLTWLPDDRVIVRAMTADGARDFIVNLDDPLAPVIEATVPSFRPDTSTFLASGYLGYIYGDSLRVVDLSDPAHPRRLSALGVASFIPVGSRPVIAGGCLWVAIMDTDFDRSLLGFSLTDPVAPALISRTPVPMGDYRMQGDDGWLVLSGLFGVHAIDITDPARPAVVSMGSGWSMHGPLGFRNDQCVIASWGCVYMAPLPCRSPVPAFLSQFSVLAGTQSVALTWTIAGGFPGEFQLAARAGADSWSVPFSATPDGFAARDASARLAAGGTVTYTLRHRQATDATWETLAERAVELAAPPRPIALLAPHPNPFNPAVRVAYVLAAAQHVRIAVFDLAGRRVATLADGAFTAGRHELDWRGSDDRGASAASGNYLVRIEGEMGNDTRRITLIR